jgi:hypothetical protein
VVLADVGDGDCFAFRIPGIDEVVSECLGNWIEFIQELIASNPQRAGTVFEQGRNVYPAQTVRPSGLVLKHFELVSVVPVQPVLRAKPQEAPVVLDNLGYLRL